jgi:quercetin dioxygenase-like cupin family protein
MMQEPTLAYTKDVETYSPILYHGTLNRRLVPGMLAAGFELAHGTLAPGGSADRHLHETEWQVSVMVSGQGRLQMGYNAATIVGPGAVIRIPPGVAHLFHVIGDVAAEVLVLYAPALGRAGFTATP